ncbi:MAG: hypothetical protein QXE62_06955 [Candidatus Nitrosocaldaceae archaeon]
MSAWNVDTCNHKFVCVDGEEVCERCGFVNPNPTYVMDEVAPNNTFLELDDWYNMHHDGKINWFNKKLTLGSSMNNAYGRRNKRLARLNQTIQYRDIDTKRYRLLCLINERFNISHEQLLYWLREIKKEDEKKFNFKKGLYKRVLEHLKERGIKEYEGMSIDEYLKLLFDVNL